MAVSILKIHRAYAESTLCMIILGTEAGISHDVPYVLCTCSKPNDFEMTPLA